MSCELGNCGWYCSFSRRENRAGEKKRKDKSRKNEQQGGEERLKQNREDGNALSEWRA